jgi:hypothetical protein
VRFDDRLKTVLAQRAASSHDRAVRWRQLVELAARAPSDGDAGLYAEAIREIREGSSSVEERVRSAAALAVAFLPIPVELVAAFAGDKLSVAAPILAGARLTASEWKGVTSSASDESRAFIATMRYERPPTAATPAADRDEPPHIPSISDVVARIERLRQSRELAASQSGVAAADGDQPRLFRWECNESGEIGWVEGAPRGALVGQSIANGGSAAGVDRKVERAFASRAPFSDGILELPGDSAIGGSWKIGGIPAFDAASGRFAGYRGIAERVDPGASASAGPNDPDTLRELAHEIKTPLNAIIGFAEIICGEYLGPAGGTYRERAGEIVTQARLLLGAIEDLDFAARVRSAAPGNGSRSDLGEMVGRLVAGLSERARARGVEIEAASANCDLAAIQPEVAERLILRMCDAVIGRAGPGETLRLTVGQDNGHCLVSISRPQALIGLGEEALFGTSDDALSPAFPLRLARGLAQTAGTTLGASDSHLSLVFPRA